MACVGPQHHRKKTNENLTFCRLFSVPCKAKQLRLFVVYQSESDCSLFLAIYLCFPLKYVT